LDVIRDELDEGSVGILEVDTCASAERTWPLHWSCLDRHVMPSKVRHRLLDRSGPLKAQVGVARPHWDASDVGTEIDAGAVNIHLSVAEPK
jgi:hypothetical protein